MWLGEEDAGKGMPGRKTPGRGCRGGRRREKDTGRHLLCRGGVVGIIAEEEIIFGRTLEDGVDVADVDDGLERRRRLRVVGEDESLASLLG